MKRFFHAVATLSGLIIGVGIFGVPYVVVQVGFWAGIFWIGIVGALVLTVHLLYGEVIAATRGKHRLPGYVGHIFGKEGKRTVLIIDVVRFWGLQLAYMIVGGTFLNLLLQPYFGGTPFSYSILLFGIVALTTFFGLRVVDKVEFYLTWVLIGALLFIVGRGMPYINVEELFTSGGGNFFNPYGVIMVSLAGAAAIPEIWDITRRNKKIFRASIVVGTLIPIIVTALFAFVVVGVSGQATSQEAIAGLETVLGSGIVVFGAFIGFIAITTSYFVIALYLQEALKYDFLVKHTPAWAFAIGVPLLLYFIGAHNFIAVIDIVGSVLFGVEGVLIIAALLVMIKRGQHHNGHAFKVIVGVLAAILLVVGVFQKLFHLF